jgi:hypothetical protein
MIAISSLRQASLFFLANRFAVFAQPPTVAVSNSDSAEGLHHKLLNSETMFAEEGST